MIIFIDDGGGASSNETLIQSVTTSGSQTSVTFSSIPGTYKALRLTWMARQASGAAPANLVLRFNGDTGSNYDSNRWNRGGVQNLTAQTSAMLGELTKSDAPSGSASIGEAVIPFYASTVFHKTFSTGSTFKHSQSSTGIVQENNGGVWRSTSAISSITLFMSNAVAFEDGSTFNLYGMVP